MTTPVGRSARISRLSCRQIKFATRISRIFTAKKSAKRRLPKRASSAWRAFPPGILLEILKEAGASVGGSTTDFQPLTPADLMSLGLTGGANSATLRQGVLKALDLPENLTVKMLLRWVTSEEKGAAFSRRRKNRNGA